MASVDVDQARLYGSFVVEDTPDWTERYGLVRGKYEALARRLHTLLPELLADAGIDVVQIEVRTKSLRSFQEKVSRKGGKYANPLEDVSDLIGLRVITYYAEDVQRVGTLIAEHFEVDEERSEYQTDFVDPDRFGYSSAHYVVALTQQRVTLPEWRPYSGVVAEVQVRSLLQHAWAALSHKLDYKTARDVPRDLRRRLFRLSALFELADEQLSDLRATRSVIDEAYRDEVSRGELDLDLDIASLNAYMGQLGSRIDMEGMAERAGFTVRDPQRPEDRAKLERSRLLEALNAASITTLRSLDNFLRGEKERLARLIALVAETYSSGPPKATIDDLLTQVLMLHAGVDRAMYNRLGYNEDDWALFVQALERSNVAGATPVDG